jgi:hypothetical protein
VWSAAGHAHIELRKVDPSQLDKFAQRLEAELSRHHAVRWVETVGAVGRVVVAFDEDAAPVEDLLDSVGSVEEEFDVHWEPFAADTGSHPADAEPIIRGAAHIGGAAVGLGLATVQQAARLRPIPFMGYAVSGLSLLPGRSAAVPEDPGRVSAGRAQHRKGVGDQRGHVRLAQLLRTADAEQVAQPPGREDLHVAGGEAAVGDLGAVHAHHRAHADPKRGTDCGGFQPQRAEGVVHRVVVVPHPPIGGSG